MQTKLFSLIALLLTFGLVYSKAVQYIDCTKLTDPTQKCICAIRNYTAIRTVKSENACSAVLPYLKDAVETVCASEVKAQKKNDRNGYDCIKAFVNKQAYCDSYVSKGKKVEQTCSDKCVGKIQGLSFTREYYAIMTVKSFPYDGYARIAHDYTEDDVKTNNKKFETCPNWRKESF